MSNNVKALLIGAGYMGKEYGKVLRALKIPFSVICRSESTAKKYYDDFNVMPIFGGVGKALETMDSIPYKAIVAVNVEELANTTVLLIKHGIKEILVEKPAGLNRKEIARVCEAAKEENANVYVAYNRRFYATTERALEIIKADGVVSSFNFEFTEWGFKIENTTHPAVVKEEWLLANSSHVIDLAFFFGGNPVKLTSYHAGSLHWHNRASKYVGAGITDKDALFSYQANWNAPGRWGVEILTDEHRLFLRPLERLFVQNKGSVDVDEIHISDQLDIDFKPGLYKQVKAFFSEKKDSRLLTIEDQVKHMDFYDKIENMNKTDSNFNF